jgi:transcriptional regulator with XRE-family HTH domain
VDKREHNAIIAENILVHLHQRKLSQKDFAKEIGIAPSTLTDYIKLRTIPSHGVIQKMADFFGIEKSELDTTYRPKTLDLNQMLEQADTYKDYKLDDATRSQLGTLIRDFLKANGKTLKS